MSKVQMLRVLVNQRLTAAAEEIFVLFERTIAEYEEELCRSKEEKERQRKLLDAVFNTQLQLHRADVQQLSVSEADLPSEQQEWSLSLEISCDVQQLSESKEEVPPEQQERSFSLDQENPEPPHVKEEQEELWTSQEGEKLQGQEEADITRFTFTPVPVKTEDDEKLQSSEIHQRQAAKMETGADGKDCRGPEPARNTHPDRHLQPDTDDKTSDSSEIDDSDDDWTETREPQSRSATLKNNEDPLSDVSCNAVQRSFSCSESGQRSEPAGDSHPDSHLQPDTDDKTSNSSETEDSDEWKSVKNNDILCHNSCNTSENSFSCSECDKKFSQKGHLIIHQRIHTGEKPFSCSVCGKRFVFKGSIRRHMIIHTGEKPFSCSICGKAFNQKVTLQQHIRGHRGEKPFSCPFCCKRFTKRSAMADHMVVHTGEKRFCCSVCDKRFTWYKQRKIHKCVGESSQLQQSQAGENREGEPPASRQMETEADGEDCGGSEPAKNSHQDSHLQPDTDNKTSDSSETEDSDELKETSIHHSSQPNTEVNADDRKETRERQSGLNTLKNKDVSMRQNTGKKAFSCSECGKKFGFESHLKRHVKIHTVEKSFDCPDCCKRYKKEGYLKRHMRIHSGENI